MKFILTSTGTTAAADSSTGDLIGVAAAGVLLIVGSRRLGTALFALIAHLNDPHGPDRWKRSHAPVERVIQLVLLLGGVSFVVYALLDALGVISLAE